MGEDEGELDFVGGHIGVASAEEWGSECRRSHLQGCPGDAKCAHGCKRRGGDAIGVCIDAVRGSTTGNRKPERSQN